MRVDSEQVGRWSAAIRECDPLEPWLTESTEDENHECFFDFCQKTISFGPDYEAWRAEIDQRMRDGYEIASLGPYA